MIDFTTDVWNLITLIIASGVTVLAVNLVFLNISRLLAWFRRL